MNSMALGKTNLSTEEASYSLINNILDALNNKFTVGGIFCNLTFYFALQIRILWHYWKCLKLNEIILK